MSSTVKTDAEAVKALYFDADALTAPPYKVYRYDHFTGRFYYALTQEGEIMLAPSVTTIIRDTVPQAETLVKWIAENGYAESQRLKSVAANYGTLLHVAIAKLLVDGTFDLDSVGLFIAMFKQKKGITYETPNWADKLCHDICAFNAFASKHNLKPLAVELTLFSEKFYAGTIDLVAEMDVGTGANGAILKRDKPEDIKRKTVLIDLKSSRKSFYWENGLQAVFYADMWDENFGHGLGNGVQHVFNWRPKNWDESPTYELKEWDREEFSQIIPALCLIYLTRSKFSEQKVNIFFGQVRLGITEGGFSRVSQNGLIVDSAATSAGKARAIVETSLKEFNQSYERVKKEGVRPEDVKPPEFDNAPRFAEGGVVAAPVVAVVGDESPELERKKNEAVPAPASPPKKRKRRTKKEMEEARAAEKAEQEEKDRNNINKLEGKEREQAEKLLTEISVLEAERDSLKISISNEESELRELDKRLKSETNGFEQARLDTQMKTKLDLIKGKKELLKIIEDAQLTKTQEQLNDVITQRRLPF